MVIKIIPSKENRPPLAKDTANTSSLKGNKKKKPTAMKKVTSRPKPIPAPILDSSDDASSDSDENQGEEASMEEDEDEDSAESQEAIAVPLAKKLTKQEVAAAKAAPALKAKKVKAVEKEEYEIVQVKVSAKEKRLQAKLDAMTKAYEEVTTSFENLRGLRYTRAEESEKALTDLASARNAASLNTLAKYKQDNESLRNELTNLLDSSPELSSSLLLSEEIAALQTTTDALTQHKLRLEEQVRDLRTRLEEGDKMRRDAEKKERKKVEDERETIVKARVAETHSALKSAQKDLDQAKAELAAEVSHSKSLQAKLATSTFASSSAAHAGGSGGSDRLREENESLKARLGLNEDLTGLQVTSMAEQPEGIVFSCIISDFLCKNGTLDFKVQFPADGTFCYTPNLEAERDSVMINLLPVEYRSFMRFDAYEAGRWYKKLLYSINKM